MVSAQVVSYYSPFQRTLRARPWAEEPLEVFAAAFHRRLRVDELGDVEARALQVTIKWLVRRDGDSQTRADACKGYHYVFNCLRTDMEDFGGALPSGLGEQMPGEEHYLRRGDQSPADAAPGEEGYESDSESESEG